MGLALAQSFIRPNQLATKTAEIALPVGHTVRYVDGNQSGFRSPWLTVSASNFLRSQKWFLGLDNASDGRWGLSRQSIGFHGFPDGGIAVGVGGEGFELSHVRRIIDRFRQPD
jgi:hypothetical protein